ncbi:hypothetical protein T190_26025 [Sinorhizobium meliloti CCBAU 01290]|nr:hypothetical protein T190_26025 [Sinorhizobium meliloti CCBAU 01290]
MVDKQGISEQSASMAARADCLTNKDQLKMNPDSRSRAFMLTAVRT